MRRQMGIAAVMQHAAGNVLGKRVRMDLEGSLCEAHLP